MDDKTFELLEKMYSDISKRLDSLESGQQELKAGQQRIEITLENDMKSSLQALHERAAGNTAKLDEHTQRLEAVENKLDYMALSVNSQDKRLELVETTKHKKAK